MIQWKVERPGLRLGLGDCKDYDGDADFIFTDLYGPLPAQLSEKPGIINLVGRKKVVKAERWIGRSLHPIGVWGAHKQAHLYTLNIPPKDIDLNIYQEDEYVPGQGFFPLNFCMALLSEFAPLQAGIVFDGCMGRGTVGKAALELGFHYVGIDIDPARVELARQYLGCTDGLQAHSGK